jgi:hypothetical protein
MQMILKFNLPEDKEEACYALNGHLYRQVLHEFDQHLRSIVKYSSGNSDDASALRDKLHELIDDSGCDLYS